MHSLRHRHVKFISKIKTWHNPPQEIIEKIRKSNTGKPSFNKGKKIAEISGEFHWNWKGGKTDENAVARNSLEYEIWRDEVYQKN